jgi:DNA-binding MarR family transcriptional regulator
MEEPACQNAPLDTALPAELTGYFSWLLAHSAHILGTSVGCQLKSIQLSFRSFAVLSALSEEPISSQLKLARRIGLDKTTMMNTLDELETEELIERGRSQEDRRLRTVLLTRSGAARLEKAKGLISTSEEEALAGLPALKQQQLHALLNELGSSLHSNLPTGGSCV